MDICDAVTAQGPALTARLARHLFDGLPEDCPLLLIMDRSGRSWPSNAQESHRLGLGEEVLRDIRVRLDDGAEPVVMQHGDVWLAAASVGLEGPDAAYAVIALPRRCQDSNAVNLDLAEALLHEVSLVAKLLEAKDRPEIRADSSVCWATATSPN